jgi:hypothetical protein
MTDPEIPFHLFVRDFHRSEKINSIIQGKEDGKHLSPHGQNSILQSPNTKIRDLFSLSHNKTPREKQAAKSAKDAALLHHPHHPHHPKPPAEAQPEKKKKTQRKSQSLLTSKSVTQTVKGMTTVHIRRDKLEKTDSHNVDPSKADVYNVVANRKKKAEHHQLHTHTHAHTHREKQLAGDGSGVTDEELNIGLEIAAHWGAKGHTRAAFELQTQALQAQDALPRIESLAARWKTSRDLIKLNYVKRIRY